MISARYRLDTLKGDVDATIRSFGRVSGPTVLVGHSRGETLIAHTGLDTGPDDGTARGEQDARSHHG